MAVTKHKQYWEGVGKRKTAIARVRLVPDSKNHFTVNDQPVDKYFAPEYFRILSQTVLALAPNEKFAITAKITGGGNSAQAQALAHGISRALLKFSPEFKAVLRKGGHLTRDARIKERRKFGLKKARKAPQWSKR